MSVLESVYNLQRNIRYMVLFFAISMFSAGVFFSNTTILLIAICGILMHNLWYSFESFSNRIVFLAFNGTFFIFLVGRLIVKSVTNYTDKYNNNAFGLDFTDDQVVMRILVCLFLSLFFLFLGYSNMKNNNPITKIEIKLFKRSNIEYIALVSKLAFYFTYVFNALVLWDKAKFTNAMGYTELYSSYVSSFPGWVTKLSEMCPTALFIYLGTLPTKKKAAVPLVLYLLLGGLSLVVGQRNNFVLNILVILVYLCLRNITDKKEKWFGKKEIILCLSTFPLLIVLLNAVSYYRMDSEVANHSFVDGVSEFFYSQGVSVNLIGYAQTLAGELPPDKIYTFGRIEDFINNNTITQSITDAPKYEPQTLESALYGNSFADSVSYLLSPNRYLNGWGFGSSYVAELYKDFGYVGVAIGNVVLGIILSLMTRLFKSGILGVWVCLSMTRLLLYAPRDTATSFIVSTFSLINILTIVVICIGVWVLAERRQRFGLLQKDL
ncbi:O-antigen polysaccharide polymerase Wzy family protein [Priestia megaterium]|uniref:O-antigen polysaccharide polymerase Wzy family protein n=1 Tax=Priestia megaterium TaxID=1404 RepID=UPI00345A225F